MLIFLSCQILKALSEVVDYFTASVKQISGFSFKILYASYHPPETMGLVMALE